MYIYQFKKWPNFYWDQAALTDLLADVRYHQGLLLGYMSALGLTVREQACVQMLTEEIVKTCEIEGVQLDSEHVRSSIVRRMGVDYLITSHNGCLVEGMVEMMFDVMRNYEISLTEERIFKWHKAAFPKKKYSTKPFTIGKWRTKKSNPIQIIFNADRPEKIHYEAPGHDKIKQEMKQFIKWYNADTELDLIIKSALAHFWFVTLHPFDEGTGRVARAITDMLLARSEQIQQRFYSMSAQIQLEHKEYYHILQQCQKGTLDVTLWLEWFLNCFKRAILAAKQSLEKSLIRTIFWQTHESENFNQRQRYIINRLLDKFEDKLTSSTWAKLGKCSQDTALRDISDLLDRQILIKEVGGGRSTSYILSVVPHPATSAG